MIGVSDVQPVQPRWKVRAKNRFLHRILQELAGKAWVSFEGGPSVLGLMQVPGAGIEETPVLRRSTIAPRQNLVIVPLTHDTIEPIWKGVGGTLARDVLHVQIERDGKLVFAAYDRFHPGCVAFGTDFPEVLLHSLIEDRLLEEFSGDPDLL